MWATKSICLTGRGLFKLLTLQRSCVICFFQGLCPFYLLVIIPHPFLKNYSLKWFQVHSKFELEVQNTYRPPPSVPSTTDEPAVTHHPSPLFGWCVSRRSDQRVMTFTHHWNVSRVTALMSLCALLLISSSICLWQPHSSFTVSTVLPFLGHIVETMQTDV